MFTLLVKRFYRILNANLQGPIFLSFILLSGCNSHNTMTWHQSRLSQNGQFQVHLSCKTPPQVNRYQDCFIRVMKVSGEIVFNANLVVEGGMPAHKRGLPTHPIAASMNEQGAYRIDGLKYNLAGAWMLGFLIRTPQQQDKVIFDFII